MKEKPGHKIFDDDWPELKTAFRFAVEECGCSEEERITCQSETLEMFCLRCFFRQTYIQGAVYEANQGANYKKERASKRG
jgi:hypothetical protein